MINALHHSCVVGTKTFRPTLIKCFGVDLIIFLIPQVLDTHYQTLDIIL